MSSEYRIYYDEEKEEWVATDDTLQLDGTCKPSSLKSEYSDIAPALALIDALGYDINIIMDDLGLI